MTRSQVTTIGQPQVSGHAPEAHSADGLIAFDGVWRHWGRGKNRWAVLRGIDLHVAPGSSVGIAGRNGAGKTTLLRIGTAILAPDHGTVTIDGLQSNRNWREYHRRLGFLSAGDRWSICTVQRARPPAVRHAAGVHAPVSAAVRRSTTPSCGSA